MELNIVYYIKDCEKRDELMEMIDVEKSQDSEYIKWQEKQKKIGEKIGEENGKKEIIRKFLESMSPEEISEKIGMSPSEIKKIAQ